MDGRKCHLCALADKNKTCTTVAQTGAAQLSSEPAARAWTGASAAAGALLRCAKAKPKLTYPTSATWCTTASTFSGDRRPAAHSAAETATMAA